ncbi:MAG: FAD-binding oxidoreductase [Bacteroidia bacterium]|nr:FAD-binding oxidoreductase [Bacteroidia bacterium]
MKDRKHIAILGGGLAGTFLALNLCRRGHQVTMMDDRNPNSASRAAAGLYNVITGRFGAKSWMAETLLKEINSFFFHDEWPDLNKYIHPEVIYRPFKTIEEYNKWTVRSADPEYAHLVEFSEKPIYPNLIENPFGGIKILPCGWVETRAFVDAAHEFMESKYPFHFIPYRIAYDQIDLANKTISRDATFIRFDHIVFAQGHFLTENPFFPKIKVIPNKGEILLIETDGWKLPFTLSKKIYMVHRTKNRYVVGSNYQNRFEHPNPSPEGREEIEFHLQKAIRQAYKVVDHWAGIRPTTPNRRPIIGTHAKYQHAHVLGGFGTKGILLGPYFSGLLADRIEGSSPDIPEEAKLDRFL